MVTVLAAVFGLFLAYANGANDNFKGVATLFGSATADYRRALLWATVTTFAGSLAAVTLAGSLVIAFTGKGLVPDALVGAPAFTLGVAAAAGITVMLATRFGLPISTTHALTGALVGAGFAAVMTDINLGQLWIGFFRPLMISPVLAIAAAALLYPLLHRTRKAIGVERETCLCVGETVVATVPGAATPGQGLTANMTTTSIVLAASWFGLPVSTTHVSCGALFGIGAVTGHAKWKTIATIVAAWVTTLPLAAGLGWAAYMILEGWV